MKKIILIAALVLGIALFVIKRYGYLTDSVRNMPPSMPLPHTSPVQHSTSSVQISDPSLSFLSLPPGFHITYYAKDVPGARSMALGDDGTVYVGTRQTGVVYALPDTDGDGQSDARFVVASGLNSPNGVAFRNKDLFISEIHRVIVFRGIESAYRNTPEYSVVYDQLPKDTHHGWRYISFGPDGLLYIGIGMPCNICDDRDMYGRIIRLNVDEPQSGFEVFAVGIRNTVGFDWNPADGSLWFTDNGRDWLGDNQPPDELNHAYQKDLHFGFPYCNGDQPDAQFSRGSCSDYQSPFVKLDAHVAALGMKFYRGNMYPDTYNRKIFIAEHGSWNSSAPVGYRIEVVDPQTGMHSVFLSGFLDESGNAKGRPVDILELSDGSLLVSDDKAGSIYRITYRR